MIGKLFPKSIALLAISGSAILVFATLRNSKQTVAAQTGVSQGALQALDPTGKLKGNCPLKHTAVKAEISGFLSRVVVTQEFENPYNEKIEAVYTFPLPQNAAVDDMTMLIGNRTVRGLEGVLASFPPLPGDSIVVRPLSQNVETIARVLKRDGYSTVFLYGGRGIFDGMRSFAINNGYDRFVERISRACPR